MSSLVGRRIITQMRGNVRSSRLDGYKTMERVGFELVGIGIQLPKVANYFGNYCVIQNVAELPSALFGQLERLLT